MPTRNDAFPSKYLKADDLGDKPIRAKIKAVTYETVGDKEKLVVAWDGPPWKPLPLNVTNFESCEAAFGKPNSDDWPDEEIEIRSEKVRDPQGKLVKGVRLHAVPPPRKPDATVRVVPNKPNPPAGGQAEATPPVSAYEELNDEIPDDV